MNDLIKFVEAENAARRADLPEFSAGDTINVYVKIQYRGFSLNIVQKKLLDILKAHKYWVVKHQIM